MKPLYVPVQINSFDNTVIVRINAVPGSLKKIFSNIVKLGVYGASMFPVSVGSYQNGDVWQGLR